MNTTQVLHALTVARTTPPPTDHEQVVALLTPLYPEIIEPLRNWIIDLECAVDEVERTGEALYDAAPTQRPRLHTELNDMLDCVVDALAEIYDATIPLAPQIPAQDRTPGDDTDLAHSPDPDVRSQGSSRS